MIVGLRVGFTMLCLIPLGIYAEGYDAAIQSRGLLKTDTTFAGQAIRYPEVLNPEVTALEILIPAGAETGWHTHPFPGYAYVLSGELTVELENGVIHRFIAGQSVAESVDKIHNGRNLGKVPVKLIAFFTGEKGKAFTEKVPVPAR
jgi:quercetin dioxygenase-like cupin family protein